jgi:hypothetical protein
VDGAASRVTENPDGFSPDVVETAKARKAKKKYEGLFTCPASDGNFTGAIQRLSVDELESFKAELITRDLDEHCHKGRINAVAKEKRRRGSGSTEMVAVVKLKEELQEADLLYLDGKPYDLDRIDNEVSFFQAQAGESLLEIGKRFILVKLHEDHGKFLAFLEKHDMGTRSSEYAMAAARKFANSQTFANLGASKMIALSVLDDDSIQSLEDGEKAAGVTLDEIDRMSVREVREALRAEREKRKKEKQAREDAISKKEEQINELEHKLRYQEPPTREQLAQVRLDELRRQFLIPINCVSEYYREAIAILDEAQRIEGITIPQLEAFVEHFSEELEILEGLRVDYEETVDNIRPQSNAGVEG